MARPLSAVLRVLIRRASRRVCPLVWVLRVSVQALAESEPVLRQVFLRIQRVARVPGSPGQAQALPAPVQVLTEQEPVQVLRGLPPPSSIIHPPQTVRVWHPVERPVAEPPVLGRVPQGPVLVVPAP